MDRRTFMTRAVTAIGLLIGAVIGIPSFILAISPTLKKRGPTWRSVGSISDFEIGEVQRATIQVPRDDWAEALSERAVYVWRPASDEVVVFSRNCTDLSCPVRWDAGSERFFCPCHGGIFAKDGQPVAGPPQRPLWRYATRLENGNLQVDLNSLPPIT